MLYDCKRISYWIDRRLTGLAGPDYAATISFGLPLEPEDSQYGESRLSTHIEYPTSARAVRYARRTSRGYRVDDRRWTMRARSLTING